MSLKDAIQDVQDAIEKAKVLTTKDRKALKSSTYCGPNRSYPCPDCQHVSTAKAFLARGKFSPATKAKIAACINRKAKEMNCGGEKKAKALVNLEQDLENSDIFKSTRELVSQSEKNPGLELDFSELTQLDDLK
jgi:hypothetical protein